jgi:hypothetical protein
MALDAGDESPAYLIQNIVESDILVSPQAFRWGVFAFLGIGCAVSA